MSRYHVAFWHNWVEPAPAREVSCRGEPDVSQTYLHCLRLTQLGHDSRCAKQSRGLRSLKSGLAQSLDIHGAIFRTDDGVIPLHPIDRQIGL